MTAGSIACESEPGPSAAGEGPPLDTPAAVTETTPKAPPPAAEPQRGPKVVFLGDSLAAGLHLPATQAFPAVLQRQLADDGVPFRLINAGVSGDTTAGGLRRVDWLLDQDPEVVVVELGANDGLRGQPVAEIEKNLRAIVRRVKDQGAEVLLLGMRVPPSHGAAYAREFAAVYPRVAKATSVPLVPFLLEDVAGEPELNLPDGIHPTAEGHVILAENVEPALRRLLQAL